ALARPHQHQAAAAEDRGGADEEPARNPHRGRVMDARRLLTLACAGLALTGCATLRDMGVGARASNAPAAPAAAAPAAAIAPAPRPLMTSMAPIPNPPEGA